MKIRVLQVTPEEEQIPIGPYVRAVGDISESPLIPNANRGRGQGRGGDRGRRRGRGSVKAPITALSGQGNSGSHRGRGRGLGRWKGRASNIITREEFADEILGQFKPHCQM
uniref:Uncharacterized protein n=1 Tax=Lactuca sativa TaxID=4236 RepID=A0A9R1W3T2_LACSA|nr:hypothetical protein LSAT_V11C300149740 [Lactuca sativa]